MFTYLIFVQGWSLCFPMSVINNDIENFLIFSIIIYGVCSENNRTFWIMRKRNVLVTCCWQLCIRLVPVLLFQWSRKFAKRDEKTHGYQLTSSDCSPPASLLSISGSLPFFLILDIENSAERACSGKSLGLGGRVFWRGQGQIICKSNNKN